MRTRVLFLCTGNSARSQLAEALLGQLGGDAIEAASAGSPPRPLHPDAVLVMREYGIDISGRRAKHLDTFAGQRFGYVISLCDRVARSARSFPATRRRSTGASPTRPVTAIRRSAGWRPSCGPGSASCSGSSATSRRAGR